MPTMSIDPFGFGNSTLNFLKFLLEKKLFASHNATQALLALNAACEATLSYEAYRDTVAGKRDTEREQKVAKTWNDVAVWVGKFAKDDDSAALLVSRLECKGEYWCQPGDIFPEDIERLGIGLDQIKSDVKALLKVKL